jgi:hypothetical protein
MKKYFCVLFFYLFALQLLSAQNYDEQGESRYGYTPIRQGKYWGVIDSTGHLVAPCQYQTAQVVGLDCNKPGLLLNGLYCFMSPDSLRCYQQLFGFVDGYAQACNNYKCGYINTEGVPIVPIEYTISTSYRSDLLLVANNGKHGCLQKGSPPKIVIPTLYNELKPFGNHFLIANKDNKYGLLNTDGKEILPLLYHSITAIGVDSLVMLQRNGTMYDVWLYVSSSNAEPYLLGQSPAAEIFNYDKVPSQMTKNDKWGVYNKRLQIAIPFVYKEIKRERDYYVCYSEEFIAVYDKKGLPIITLQDSIAKFNNEYYYNYFDHYIVATKGNKKLILDEYYQTISPDTINYQHHISRDIFAYTVQGKMGLATAKGKIITPPKYDNLEKAHATKVYNAEAYNEDSIVIYTIADKKGLLHLSGAALTPAEYELMDSENWFYYASKMQLGRFKTDIYNSKGILFKGTGNNLYRMSMKETYGHEPYIVCFFMEYKDIEGKRYYGLLDIEGKSILPCEYSTITPIAKGYFLVGRHEQLSTALNDSSNAINNYVGLVNDQNQLVIPIQYNTIEPFPHNKAWVVTTQQGKQLMDSSFAILTNNYYDNIIFQKRLYYDPQNIKYYYVEKNKLKGVISTNGKELIPPILPYDNLVARTDGYFNTNLGGRPVCQCGQDKTCYLGGGKWGLIDSLGNVVIAPKYAQPMQKSCNFWIGATNYRRDSVAIVNSKDVLIGTYKSVLAFAEERAAMAQCNNKWILLDSEGKQVSDYEFDKAEVVSNRNTAIVALNGKKGIINYKGIWIAKPQFDEISLVNGNYVPYYYTSATEMADEINRKILYYNIGKKLDICEGKQSEQGKWGLISPTGKIITPAIYDLLGSQKQYWIAAKNGELWGIIDTMGNKITNFTYKSIEVIVFKGKLYAIATDTMNRVGLLNLSAKTILPFAFDNIKVSDDFIIACHNNIATSVYDAQIKLLWYIVSDSLPCHSNFFLENGALSVHRGKIAAFYDADAQKVVKIKVPDKYSDYTTEYFRSYYELAILCLEDKRGLINRKGKMILPPIYDEIRVLPDNKRIKAILAEEEFWFNYKGKALEMH